MSDYLARNERPVISIPVSGTEKVVYLICWLGVAVSLAVSVLAMVYLPKEIVLESANNTGVIVRDKYALVMLSMMPIMGSLFPVLLPRYPMHRSTYLVKITLQNAEVQYKLSRLTGTLFYTSLIWWFTVMQAVSYYVWLSGRDNMVLLDSVAMIMASIPICVFLYWVVASIRRR